MNSLHVTSTETAVSSTKTEGADPAPNPADVEYAAKARGAAEKFEGFFIGQMLKQMRAANNVLADEGSVFKDPVMGDMLALTDTMLADQMAGQHAFGIADAILRQLLPQGGAATATPASGATSAATDAAANSASAENDLTKSAP